MRLRERAVPLMWWAVSWCFGVATALSARYHEEEFAWLFAVSAAGCFLKGLVAHVDFEVFGRPALERESAEVLRLSAERDALCDRLIAMEERAQRAETSLKLAQGAQASRKELS